MTEKKSSLSELLCELFEDNEKLKRTFEDEVSREAVVIGCGNGEPASLVGHAPIVSPYADTRVRNARSDAERVVRARKLKAGVPHEVSRAWQYAVRWVAEKLPPSTNNAEGLLERYCSTLSIQKVARNAKSNGIRHFGEGVHHESWRRRQENPNVRSLSHEISQLDSKGAGEQLLCDLWHDYPDDAARLKWPKPKGEQRGSTQTDPDGSCTLPTVNDSKLRKFYEFANAALSELDESRRNFETESVERFRAFERFFPQTFNALETPFALAIGESRANGEFNILAPLIERVWTALRKYADVELRAPRSNRKPNEATELAGAIMELAPYLAQLPKQKQGLDPHDPNPARDSSGTGAGNGKTGPPAIWEPVPTADYFPSRAFRNKVASDTLAKAGAAGNIRRTKIGKSWHYSWSDAHRVYPQLVPKEPPFPSDDTRKSLK